jgi:LacI family transcriptional regulator
MDNRKDEDMNKNQKNPVTIKTIASEVGLSFSTVAKALNEDPLIKEETRARVREKAAEMGYCPNVMARSLRNNSTKNIALIFNDIENPSLAHIFGRITKEMGGHGYSTLICDSQYDTEVEERNISTVLSRKPEAVIISPVTSDPARLRLLKNMADRVIVLGDTLDGFQSNYVHVDYALGGYLSAAEMIANGHTSNMVITEPEYCPICRQFIQGVEKAYREYGLSLDREMMYYCPPSIENGRRYVMEQYGRESGFTGVITSCDSLAYGVYKAAAALGLSIPGDIIVIGIDDYALSGFAMPPLTTVCLPTERIAERCVEVLNTRLKGDSESTRIFSIEPHLAQRKSVKKIT